MKAQEIEELVNQFIKEELPDAKSPFHHEAEIAAGMEHFISWIKQREEAGIL